MLSFKVLTGTHSPWHKSFHNFQHVNYKTVGNTERVGERGRRGGG